MTANVYEPFRVVFVCTGNICRSPMADVVFRWFAEHAGLGDRVVSTSAGTGEWHVGEQADQRTLRGLRRARVPCFGMKTALPEGEWAWGSQTFKSLGQHKIELIYQSLSWGLELVITDVDALVLRDPFPYVARWPDAGASSALVS